MPYDFSKIKRVSEQTPEPLVDSVVSTEPQVEEQAPVASVSGDYHYDFSKMKRTKPEDVRDSRGVPGVSPEEEQRAKDHSSVVLQAQKLFETSGEVKTPDERMMDGLNLEDQKALYEVFRKAGEAGNPRVELRNDPSEHGLSTGIVVDGVWVPEPAEKASIEKTVFGDNTTAVENNLWRAPLRIADNFMDLIKDVVRVVGQEALHDGPVEMLTFALALGGGIEGMLQDDPKRKTKYLQSAAQKVDELFPRYDQVGKDFLVGEFSKIFLPVLGEAKLALETKKGVQTLSRLVAEGGKEKNLLAPTAQLLSNPTEVSKFSKFLAAEGGMAASMDPREHTSVIGELLANENFEGLADYMIKNHAPVMGYFAVNDEGKFDENYLRQKLGLFLENMALSAAVGGTIGAAKYGKKFANESLIKPVRELMNSDYRNGQIVLRAAERVRTLSVPDLKSGEFTKLINKGKSVDVTSEAKEGFFESATFELNTFAAGSRGAKIEVDRLTKEIEELSGQNGRPVTKRLNEAKIERERMSRIEKGFAQAEADLRNTGAFPEMSARQTGEGHLGEVIDTDVRKMDPEGLKADKASEFVIDRSDRIIEGAEQFSAGAEAAFEKEVRDTVNGLLDNSSLKKELDERGASYGLSRQLPDINVDPGKRTREYMKQLVVEMRDHEIKARGLRDSLYKDALDSVQDVEVPESLAAMLDVLGPSLRGIKVDDIVTVGDSRQLLPKIDVLAKGANYDEKMQLLALKSEIKRGQVKSLIDEGKIPPESQDLLNKADSYANEYYYEIYPSQRTTGGEKAGLMVIADPNMRKASMDLDKPRDTTAGGIYLDQNIEEINRTLQSQTRSQFDVLFRSLKENDAEDRVGSLLRGLMADKLEQLALKSGGLEKAKAAEIISEFQKLPWSTPELRAEANNLAQSLVKNIDNLEKMGATLKEFQSIKEVEVQKIKELELERFMDPETRVLKDKSTTDIFQDMIYEANEGGNLSPLVKQIKTSGNLLAQQGIEATWWKSFRKSITSPEGNVSGRYIDEVLDPNSKRYQVAKDIFRPEAFDYMQFLVKESREASIAQGGVRAGPVKGVVPDVANNSKAALKMLINLKYGALNPAGIQKNILGRKAVDIIDPKESVSLVMDTFFHNPDEFILVFNTVAKKFGKDGKLDPTLQALYTQMISKSLIGGTWGALTKSSYQDEVDAEVKKPLPKIDGEEHLKSQGIYPKTKSKKDKLPMIDSPEDPNLKTEEDKMLEEMNQ